MSHLAVSPFKEPSASYIVAAESKSAPVFVLPLELLLHVAKDLANLGSLQTLSSLARTNKSLFHLLTPLLYRQIALSSSKWTADQLRSFQRDSQKTGKWSCVKMLRMDFGDPLAGEFDPFDNGDEELESLEFDDDEIEFGEEEEEEEEGEQDDDGHVVGQGEHNATDERPETSEQLTELEPPAEEGEENQVWHYYCDDEEEDAQVMEARREQSAWNAFYNSIAITNDKFTPLLGIFGACQNVEFLSVRLGPDGNTLASVYANHEKRFFKVLGSLGNLRIVDLGTSPLILNQNKVRITLDILIHDPHYFQPFLPSELVLGKVPLLVAPVEEESAVHMVPVDMVGLCHHMSDLWKEQMEPFMKHVGVLNEEGAYIHE